MSNELKTEEFLIALPQKLQTILQGIDNNLTMLKELEKILKAQNRIIGNLQKRVTKLELSQRIIH
jgi:hypothetical protein